MVQHYVPLCTSFVHIVQSPEFGRGDDLLLRKDNDGSRLGPSPLCLPPLGSIGNGLSAAPLLVSRPTGPRRRGAHHAHGKAIFPNVLQRLSRLRLSLMGQYCDCSSCAQGAIFTYTIFAFLYLLLSMGGTYSLVRASEDTSFNMFILRFSVIAFVAAVLFIHLSLFYLFENLLPVTPYSRLATALAFSFATSVVLNILCLATVVNVFTE